MTVARREVRGAAGNTGAHVVAQRPDHDRRAGRVVARAGFGTSRRRCCRHPAPPRDRRVTAAGSRARLPVAVVIAHRSSWIPVSRAGQRAPRLRRWRAGAVRGSIGGARRRLPAAPRITATTGRPHATSARPWSAGFSMMRSPYTADVRVDDLAVATGRRRCGRGCRRGSRGPRARCCRRPIRPSQTGHASSSFEAASARFVRVRRLGARHEHDERARDDHAEQQPRTARAPAHSRAPRRARTSAPGCRPSPRRTARPATTPVGTDHERLRLPGGAEGERRLALRVECDRPADVLPRRRSRAPCPLSSSRTMPTIAKSGSSLWSS